MTKELQKIIRYGGKQYYCATKAEYFEHSLLALIDAKGIATGVSFKLLEEIVKTAQTLYPDNS